MNSNPQPEPTSTACDILSPDGFPIRHEPFDSPAEAWAYFEQWRQRFERQGYYSSTSGRIPLEALRECCDLVMLKEDNEPA